MRPPSKSVAAIVKPAAAASSVKTPVAAQPQRANRQDSPLAASAADDSWGESEGAGEGDASPSPPAAAPMTSTPAARPPLSRARHSLAEIGDDPLDAILADRPKAAQPIIKQPGPAASAASAPAGAGSRPSTSSGGRPPLSGNQPRSTAAAAATIAAKAKSSPQPVVGFWAACDTAIMFNDDTVPVDICHLCLRKHHRSSSPLLHTSQASDDDDDDLLALLDDTPRRPASGGSAAQG